MVAFSSAAFLSSMTRQRKAVDEEHHVRPAVVLVLDDRELVDRQPVVVVRIVEVDHPRLRAADGAVLRAVLDRHAVHQQAMHARGCAPRASAPPGA